MTIDTTSTAHAAAAFRDRSDLGRETGSQKADRRTHTARPHNHHQNEKDAVRTCELVDYPSLDTTFTSSGPPFQAPPKRGISERPFQSQSVTETGEGRRGVVCLHDCVGRCARRRPPVPSGVTGVSVSRGVEGCVDCTRAYVFLTRRVQPSPARALNGGMLGRLVGPVRLQTDRLINLSSFQLPPPITTARENISNMPF